MLYGRVPVYDALILWEIIIYLPDGRFHFSFDEKGRILEFLYQFTDECFL